MGALLSCRVAAGPAYQNDIEEFLNRTMDGVLLEHPWAQLLAPSQLLEIHEVFNGFDRDGNGHIEAKELSSVMRRLGLSHQIEHVQDMLDAIDLDHNGKIDFPEFVLIMAKRILEEDGKAEIECAFRLLDEDNRGKVKVEEVKTLLMKAGKVFTHEEADLFALSCPADENGEMTLEAFLSMDCWKLPPLHCKPSRKAGWQKDGDRSDQLNGGVSGKGDQRPLPSEMMHGSVRATLGGFAIQAHPG
mmetsp:Transcript_3511/g.10816  ORF Transcript_3511/g.10816 Transcript_3511/m.10816 type:complete len:245 (-) Transcript_3511:122-856(-)